MKRKFLSFALFGLVLVGCGAGPVVDLETAKARATDIQNKVDSGEVESPTAYTVDYNVVFESGEEKPIATKLKVVCDLENKYLFTDSSIAYGEEIVATKSWAYIENNEFIVAMEQGEEKGYMKGDISDFEAYVNEIFSSSDTTEMVIEPIEATKYYIEALKEAQELYADESALMAQIPSGFETEYKFENRSSGEGNLSFNFLLKYSGTDEGVFGESNTEMTIVFDNYLISRVYTLTELSTVSAGQTLNLKILLEGNFSYKASNSKPNLSNFEKISNQI